MNLTREPVDKIYTRHCFHYFKQLGFSRTYVGAVWQPDDEDVWKSYFDGHIEGFKSLEEAERWLEGQYETRKRHAL